MQLLQTFDNVLQVVEIKLEKNRLDVFFSLFDLVKVYLQIYCLKFLTAG